MIAAGTTGLIAATAAGPSRAAARGRPEAADGTPEQVHLTWGDDPTRSVVVSWASPGQAERPRVRIGQRVIAAAERACTDTVSGTVTWTYHARVDGLRPGATYGYAVTADNDANAADPFSATFTTAPAGRAAFRFTSFGDLATPSPALAGARRASDSVASPSDLARDPGAARWGRPPGAAEWGAAAGGDNWQAAYAVGAVETFQPLFHLLNGDLAYADPNPGAAAPAAWAQVWRDFGNNVQASAANRPWLPVPGNHELELGHGEQGLASYLTRYTLPSNGVDGLEGRWYAFRVGTALFVSLSGDDVAFSGAGAVAAGPAPPPTEPPAGDPPAAAGASRSVRGYSGGAQTRWLESTLAAARADASIDWIVVQLHQCACSSASAGGGSDLGVRQEWLPLFDTYEVDLVLSGHDHRYERSFPVRGFDFGSGTDTLTGAVADTRRPRPVTTVDSGVFDTSQGTVHLVLGSGGEDPAGPAGSGPGTSPRTARVFTRPASARAGPTGSRRLRQARRRRGGSGDLVRAARYLDRVRDRGLRRQPGQRGGRPDVHHRALLPRGRSRPAGTGPAGTDPASTGAGAPRVPTGDYTLFETFTLVRPRSDGRRWHPKG